MQENEDSAITQAKAPVVEKVKVYYMCVLNYKQYKIIQTNAGGRRWYN